MSRYLSARFPDALAKRIQYWCRSHDQSVSWALRTATARFLDGTSSRDPRIEADRPLTPAARLDLAAVSARVAEQKQGGL